MSKPTYGEMRTRAERIYDEVLKIRILAGLEALQAEFGDEWVEKIDCETLDLSSGSECVLGQTCGGYMEGVVMLNKEGKYNAQWASSHGFTALNGGCESWWELDESWHAILCDKQPIP